MKTLNERHPHPALVIKEMKQHPQIVHGLLINSCYLDAVK